MPNYLKMPKKSQVLALLELGWSYRRIERETGVRRETVSGYDEIRRANAAKTFPGSDLPPPADFGDQATSTVQIRPNRSPARTQIRPKRSSAPTHVVGLPRRVITTPLSRSARRG